MEIQWATGIVAGSVETTIGVAQMSSCQQMQARIALLGAGVLAVGALSSCGGATTAAPAKPTAEVQQASFAPSRFGDPARGANPYLPIRSGTQSVREGSTRVGGRAVPHQVTTTITDLHRTVDGVRTVLMLDHEVDGGQVAQVSLDYVAEDRRGNVWDLGGYTESYEGGRFVSALDTWLQGVNGAKAGILVQARPSTATPVYSVARPDAEEGDVAEVIKVGVRHCVPFDCFKDVLVVREGKASAPDNEFKYYARGVGQIDNVPRGESVHKDVERMVNLTTLSPRALAEVDKEALALDRNAARQAPKVFGNSPSASRG